jgi:predicted PP-loop superfamily ATPase
VPHAPLAGETTSRADAASLEGKEAALDGALRELPSLIVAYSGGVDSAYLAYAAHRALGANALSVTADSPSYPERHRTLALRLASEFGFNHLVIQTAEMSRPEYRANPANRCYYCKHELYTHLSSIARARYSGNCRRQQRGRSRRLSSGPAGCARVRRAESAGRGRPDEGRNPRALAACGAADLG